jgi:YD repeat-containing protein
MMAVCLGMTVKSSAQYDDMLHPQKAEEISKLKTQRFNMQTQFMELNGPETPVGISYFDAEGRILKSVNKDHHQYFTYDAAGRLASWLDSANDGRRFWKNEYSFEYDADGRPRAFQLAKKKAAFSWDASKNTLSEELSENGKPTEKHTYVYTPENKLSEEMYADISGKLIKKRRLIYNKYGDLGSEISLEVRSGEQDSTTCIYTYDNKGRLLNKKLNFYSRASRADGSADSAAPVKTVKNQTISYAYDIKGALASESLASSIPSENRKTEYRYDQLTGMLATEVFYDNTNKVSRKMNYKYFLKK